jgi:L-threonylcarbamoyladenylate synthase
MKTPSLKNAITGIKTGKLVIYPTDTLYGLGADIFNKKAIQKIFRVKRRPFTLPLPVMVSDMDMMKQIAHISPAAKKIITKFLPGPLTIILQKKQIVPDIITKEKIAIRIPNNKTALYLASHCGPLTATSANIHGGKEPVSIKIAQEQIGINDFIYLDQGPLLGIPSTIIEPTEDNIKIYRQGAISREELYG